MQAISDVLEISELLTRYCFAVDFRDLESLRGVFSADVDATYLLQAVGLDDVHLQGVDAVIGWLDSVLPGLDDASPRHALTNHLIELDGDAARSRSYRASGTGLYTVDHVRSTDGWRARRWEMRNFRGGDS